MANQRDYSLNQSRYPTRRSRMEPVKPSTIAPTKKKNLADGNEPEVDAMDVDSASDTGRFNPFILARRN